MPANRTDCIWALNLTKHEPDAHIDTRHQRRVSMELSTGLNFLKPLRRSALLRAGRYLWSPEKC